MNLVVGETQSTTLGTIIFVSLSFFLLIYLIKKFAWESISNILQQRADKIANDLDEAEQSRINAAKLEQERKESLSNSKNEAATIVKNAREAAEKNRQAMVNEAKEEVKTLKTKAKDEIEIEKEQAFQAVKEDVASFSIQLASKILNKELTKEAHESLIDSYIEGLGKQHETR